MKKLFTLFLLLSLTLSLRAQLTIDFTWCPVYDTSIQACCIQFQNLTVDSAGGTIGGYNWDFGDGDTSQMENPIHCYPVTGTFVVYLSVYYNGSLAGPDFHSLTINHLDTTDCNCDSLIGVHEITSQNFSFTISPNPFHNKAVINIHSHESKSIRDAGIRIYNSIGALVREENFVLDERQEIIFEKKSLPPGVYYLSISSKENLIAVPVMFIVE